MEFFRRLDRAWARGEGMLTVGVERETAKEILDQIVRGEIAAGGPPLVPNHRLQIHRPVFSVYDRSLLTLLYDPRIKPGMTMRQARFVLPRAIAELGLATPK